MIFSRTLPPVDDHRQAYGGAALSVGVGGLFGFPTLVAAHTPWWFTPAMVVSGLVALVGLALVSAPWWERLRAGRPPFRVEPLVTGQEWVRLAVTNDGRPRDFKAQVVATEAAAPESAPPWPVRWSDWTSEVRRIEKGETCLLDLAEADPMGGAGPEPWKLETGESIESARMGQYRFHKPLGWVPLWVADRRRGTTSLYENRFYVTVEVRSGARVVRKRLVMGYDNLLNIVADEVEDVG